MKNQIYKIFIISSGRTGTKLFGDYLNQIIPNSISVHEPDNIDISSFRKIREKIHRQSFKDLILLKSLGYLGSRNISLKYLNNNYSKEKALQKILYERRWVNDCQFYFEANQQLYGLSSILLEIPNSKVIIIFRDPRDWVRSIINKGSTYTSKDILYKINIGGFRRLNPNNLKIKSEWKYFNQFQRICWIWNYMNSNFYAALNANNKNIKHYFFEDIFIKKDKVVIQDFLFFSLGEYFRAQYVDKLHLMLQNKINQSKTNDFPVWTEWDEKHCKDLNYFCGDLMQTLGYGNEPGWLQEIN